jgi:hypothetical protein
MSKVALQQNLPGKFPNDSESSIKDRSKADGLTKIIALLQCIWLLTQTIARRYADFSISELELATIAFIPCTFFTYIIWFDKGFDVEHVTVVEISQEEFSKMETRPLEMTVIDSTWYNKDLSFTLIVDHILLAVREELQDPIVQVFVIQQG